ncbi:hypothetical protein LUZ60_007376 [Juncus effusus]|nr:hypothetical protein LUZ60_007376 [Juncus effusus]
MVISERERKQEEEIMMEDSSAISGRKIRKPYTISKSRESWSDVEHDKFIEALQLFDRDWKKIESFIGSKTVIQIRSHAQKYWKKVEKTGGTNEHLPPPRPKRKAAHPYPQKAPKFAQKEASDVSVTKLDNSLIKPVNLTAQTQGLLSKPIVSSNVSSSTDSISQSAENYKNAPSMRVMPDFGQVYNFLGSIFDPDTTDHLQTLKKMDPIDVQTVVLLMKNLSMNLTSPDFEPHRQLLYNAGSEQYSSSFSSLVQST